MNSPAPGEADGIKRPKAWKHAAGAVIAFPFLFCCG
jgi:hypothetical protein